MQQCEEIRAQPLNTAVITVVESRLDLHDGDHLAPARGISSREVLAPVPTKKPLRRMAEGLHDLV